MSKHKRGKAGQVKKDAFLGNSPRLQSPGGVLIPFRHLNLEWSQLSEDTPSDSMGYGSKVEDKNGEES